MDLVALTFHGEDFRGNKSVQVLWGLAEQSTHVTRKRAGEKRRVTQHFPDEIKRLVLHVLKDQFEHKVQGKFKTGTPVFLHSVMCVSTSQFMRSGMLLDRAYRTRPDMFALLVGVPVERDEKATKISSIRKWPTLTNPRKQTIVEVSAACKEPILLVQGPPGTGKTTLLCDLTKDLPCFTMNLAQTVQAVRNVADRRRFFGLTSVTWTQCF